LFCVGLLLAAASSLHSCRFGAPERRTPRHVVLISIDTLRADRLGIYGYSRDTTPHIDRFFSDKSVFRRASSSAPCTRPSVFQFLVGVLRPEATRESTSSEEQGGRADGGGGTGAKGTLAEVLRRRGFRTAAVLANSNFTRGRHGRGYDFYTNVDFNIEDGHGRSRISPRKKQQSMYRVTETALSWLEQNRDAEALHLWVHYFGPHRPFYPPERHRRFSRVSPENWLRELTRDDRVGDTRGRLEDAPPRDAHELESSIRQRVPQLTGLPESQHWHVRGDVFSESQVKYFSDSYDDDIAFVDEEVGKLLRRLEVLGLADDSLIILTSDHGEWLGEEDVWHHCNSLHGRELHVPLLVSLGGGPLEGGTGSDATTSTLDIVPTVLDALGIEPPRESDGTSLLDAGADRAAVAFWQRTFTVRKGRWKLYRGDFNGLFDLTTDPTESENLADRHPDVVRELERSLAEHLRHEPELRKENEELIEQLESLGYL
jgi:arylsulfatase A-like enzyme